MIDKLAIDLSGYRFKRAQDLLSQANILQRNEKYDGSINRTYYAIFNGIRSLLALANMDSSKHSGVISLFDQYFVKTGIFDKKYSEIVHSSFNIRQENDYEDFYTPTSNDSERQIIDCENFLKEIEMKRKMMIDSVINLPNISA